MAITITVGMSAKIENETLKIMIFHKITVDFIVFITRNNILFETYFHIHSIQLKGKMFIIPFNLFIVYLKQYQRFKSDKRQTSCLPTLRRRIM